MNSSQLITISVIIRKKKKTKFELIKFVENISQAVCAPTWDGASCIPPTLAGHTAILPCMNSYEGVFYSPKCKNCAYRLHTVAVCQAKLILCCKDAKSTMH